MIFKLIDVDEDECLSVGEIFKMISYIERNFVFELNILSKNMSMKSLRETSLRNSIEKFKIVMNIVGKPLEKIDQRFLNQTLIQFVELENIFVVHSHFLKVFLPRNINMESFIVVLSNPGRKIRRADIRDERGSRLHAIRGVHF